LMLVITSFNKSYVSVRMFTLPQETTLSSLHRFSGIKEHEDQAKSTYHTPKGFLGLVTENKDLISVLYVIAFISLTHKSRREP